MFLTKSVIILIFGTGLAVGRKFSFGSCPRPVTKVPFDDTLISGKWFEQQKYYGNFFRGKCTTVTYRPNRGIDLLGLSLLVVNRDMSVNQRGLNYWGAISKDVDGTLYREDVSVLDARYYAQIPDLSARVHELYYFLETDYFNFAVVWSCKNYEIYNIQELWIYTRRRDVDDNTLRVYSGFASAKGVSTWQLTRTTQNC